MKTRESAALVNIENEGLLYRGARAQEPTEIWHYSQKRWVLLHERGDYISAREISGARAEQLKSNNPDAEHFLYYDTPPWLQPMSQAYFDKVIASPAFGSRVAKSPEKP